MVTGQAVQIESGARPCTECGGKGDVPMGPACDGCGCGGRLHGVDVAPCPHCEGSKVEPCTMCGDPSVDRYLGEDLCDDCLPSEERRFSECSICSRPIDIRESRLPLCASCDRTARVAGAQQAWATRVEREERETGQRVR